MQLLAQDVGVPNEFVYDNALEQVGPGSEFQKKARYLGIACRTIEPHTQKQNKGERTIGEL